MSIKVLVFAPLLVAFVMRRAPAQAVVRETVLKREVANPTSALSLKDMRGVGSVLFFLVHVISSSRFESELLYHSLLSMDRRRCWKP